MDRSFWCRSTLAQRTCTFHPNNRSPPCDLSPRRAIYHSRTNPAPLCSWVISTLLPESLKKTNLSSNRIYDPSQSPTFKKTDGARFNISYNNGELGASGIVGTETLDIGGATASAFPIGVATDLYGQDIIDKTYDGTFGLGWPSQNTVQKAGGAAAGAPTFMDAIIGELDDKVFTCDFRANKTASISFGFVNETLYTGDLSKIPINNGSGYWSADGVTFSSGGKTLGGGGQGINVLLDTGGAATTTDQATADDYWALVKGAHNTTQGWTFPCAAAASLPELTLHFGALAATIPGALLNQSATDAGAGACLGGVQATANAHANAGFGLFASYFSVWDPRAPGISLASYSGTEDTAAQNPLGLGPTPSGGGGAEPSRTLGPSATGGAKPTVTGSLGGGGGGGGGGGSASATAAGGAGPTGTSSAAGAAVTAWMEPWGMVLIPAAGLLAQGVGMV